MSNELLTAIANEMRALAGQIDAVAAQASQVAESGPQPNPQPIAQPDPQQPSPQPVQDGNAIVLTWGQPTSWKSVEHGGFACNGRLAFRIDVPANAVLGVAYRFAVSEFSGQPTARQVTLSEAPFDFATPGPGGPITWSNGNSASITFVAGGNVQPGKSYYLNIRNFSLDLDGGRGAQSCPTGELANIIVNVLL
jgi:hypothetical protein